MGLRKPTSFPVKCVSLPLKSLQVMLGAGKHETKGKKKRETILFSCKEGNFLRLAKHTRKCNI